MLDVSDKQFVHGEDVKHWSGLLNQLYRPLSVFDADSQDIVYSRDNLNTTKFTPILLKEWFALTGTGGYLVVDYKPNKICGWRKLEEQLWWLWKCRYEIIFHGMVSDKDTRDLSKAKLSVFIDDREKYFNAGLDKKTLLPAPLKTEFVSSSKNGYVRFVCKKKAPVKIENDSIEKWTFGIITNGMRMDWMELVIASIRKQKIPQYEIIVCGTYFDRKEANFVYIPFNQKDDIGWITKKKNLIAEKAKYENICVLHDRLILEDDWYEQMCRYGNSFEYLTCSQHFEGKRAYDWLTAGGQSIHFRIKMLDYRDWDRFSFVGGMVTITKKSLICRIRWDESRFWNDYEDIQLSMEYHEAGLLSRINPQAKMCSLGFRHGVVPLKRYFPYETWMTLIPQDMYVRSIIRLVLSLLSRIPFVLKSINFLYEKVFKNSRVYRLVTKSR